MRSFGIVDTYLGIDLGGTSVKGGRIGPAGMEQKELAMLNQTGRSEELFEQICSLIDSLWSGDVAGIGFAVPGLIDPGTGNLHGLSNILQLQHFPITSRLKGRYGVPIRLQNDANCFVLGEKYFGSARDCKDVVGIATGTGVGAGVILNDRLHDGQNMAAGEVGMIPYNGKRFEDFCGGHFFRNEYGSPGEEMAERARSGEQEAGRAFDTYGAHLGELIKLLCYVLDPQMVLLGGSVSKSFNLYKPALERSLGSFYFSNSRKVIVKPSELEEAAILGAVGLFYQR